MWIYYCTNVIVYNIILLLKNFSRLVCSQLSNHNGATYFCKKCLHGHSKTVRGSCNGLLSRTEYQFPQGSKVSIYQRAEIATNIFCSLCRFESILKPINEDVDVTQVVDIGIESSTHTFQEHTPCSFSYLKGNLHQI